MRFANLITSVMAVAMPAARAAAPAPPGLTYLYTANVTLGTSFSMGVGPQGERVAIPIVGGTFSGPNINGEYQRRSKDGRVAVDFLCSSLTVYTKKGTILDLGADWGWIDTHNNQVTFHPDTRYNLRTSDGANIYIQTEGPAQVRVSSASLLLEPGWGE